MNEQHITKTTPSRDNVTPSLAALIVVGATITAATPFWPQSLGAPPPLGALLLGAGVVLAVIWHSTVWWRDLTEVQRQIHRKAWWHGGNFGILLGAAALLVVLATGTPIAPQPLSDRPAAWALFGFLCLLGGQAVGYGVAWLVHRVRA
ncbi:MAG: hypothetical protein LCH57_10930 [Proteobacteria bacterium]|nr:hypothetical protein [Pseudomonadota bacterium]